MVRDFLEQLLVELRSYHYENVKMLRSFKAGEDPTEAITKLTKTPTVLDDQFIKFDKKYQTSLLAVTTADVRNATASEVKEVMTWHAGILKNRKTHQIWKNTYMEVHKLRQLEMAHCFTGNVMLLSFVEVHKATNPDILLAHKEFLAACIGPFNLGEISTAMKAAARGLFGLPETPHAKNTVERAPLYHHSNDFISVTWAGVNYTFNDTQAGIVKILWAAWENHTPQGIASSPQRSLSCRQYFPMS